MKCIIYFSIPPLDGTVQLKEIRFHIPDLPFPFVVTVHPTFIGRYAYDGNLLYLYLGVVRSNLPPSSSLGVQETINRKIDSNRYLSQKVDRANTRFPPSKSKPNQRKNKSPSRLAYHIPSNTSPGNNLFPSLPTIP
jgi:hypothetical protein